MTNSSKQEGKIQYKQICVLICTSMQGKTLRTTQEVWISKFHYSKDKIGIQISGVTQWWFLLRAKTAAHCTCTHSWKQHFYSCKLGCSHQASENQLYQHQIVISRFSPVRTCQCGHFTHTQGQRRDKCFKKHSKKVLSNRKAENN